ncbi:stalk domain-containing protein [Paenibacillus taichungensis]
MSKILSGLLLVFAIFFSLPGQASMEQTLEISFQDDRLEQAIKDILQKDDNEAVTQRDMKSLSVVNLKGKGITRLAGLEYASNITELDLSQNEIKDIGPLRELTKLTKLNLSENQIKDLNPLKKMTKLSELDLKSNLVYDLAPLKSLEFLNVLYLDNNRVWNLEPIRNLTFNHYYDTGGFVTFLQLSNNYLDLRDPPPSKTLKILNELDGEASRQSQLKFQRLVIGSTTAYVWESPFKLTHAPFIASGRTYVPIRFVSKWLGSEVSWDQSKKEVTIRKGSRTIHWTVNEKKANVNGETVSVDAPLLLKNNSTFVPVRFVSDVLESSVEYMASPKTVLIFEKK